jgi:tetratricopeptide (TPR) repeat protein
MCGLQGEEALEALTKAVELAESHGLLDVAARAHNNLAVPKADLLGDIRAARDHLRRAAELFRQAGDIAVEAFVLCNVAYCSMVLGDFDEAEAKLSLTRQLLSELSESGRARAIIRRREAVLLAHRGEWAEAARLARAEQADAHERGDDPHLADVDTELSWILLESYSLGMVAKTGELEEAEAALYEAIEILDRLVDSSVEARAILGVIYIYRGSLKDARRALAEAQKAARAQPSAWDGPCLLWLEARLAAVEGRCSEALAAFEA